MIRQRSGVVTESMTISAILRPTPTSRATRNSEVSSGSQCRRNGSVCSTNAASLARMSMLTAADAPFRCQSCPRVSAMSIKKQCRARFHKLNSSGILAQRPGNRSTATLARTRRGDTSGRLASALLRQSGGGYLAGGGRALRAAPRRSGAARHNAHAGPCAASGGQDRPAAPTGTPPALRPAGGALTSLTVGGRLVLGTELLGRRTHICRIYSRMPR